MLHRADECSDRCLLHRFGDGNIAFNSRGGCNALRLHCLGWMILYKHFGHLIGSVELHFGAVTEKLLEMTIGALIED